MAAPAAAGNLIQPIYLPAAVIAVEIGPAQRRQRRPAVDKAAGNGVTLVVTVLVNVDGIGQPARIAAYRRVVTVRPFLQAPAEVLPARRTGVRDYRRLSPGAPGDFV